jgi:hypothetical protein
VVGVVGSLYLFNQLVIVYWSDWLSSQIPQIPASDVIATAVSLGARLLYLPLELTTITLMYLDLCARAEGSDLATRSPRPSGSTAAGTSADQVPVPKTASLVTVKELGYFFLLSLAVIALSLVQGLMSGEVQ